MNIPETENQHIEFQTEQVSALDLAEEIVAFANSEGVWLGVEDDRHLAGLSRSYDLIELQTASEKDLNYSEIADYFTRYQIYFTEENESEKRRLIQASDITGTQARPTVGGLLIFGIAPERHLPQAGIAFAHFKGREINADLLDKKTSVATCQGR